MNFMDGQEASAGNIARRLLEPLFIWLILLLGGYFASTELDFILPSLSIDPIHLYSPFYLQIPIIILIFLCAGSILIRKPSFHEMLARTERGWVGWGEVGLWLGTAFTSGFTGIMLSARYSDNIFYATVASASFVQVVLLVGSLRVELIQTKFPNVSGEVIVRGVLTYLRLLPVLFVVSWGNYLLVEWFELGSGTPRSLSLFAGADTTVEKAVFFLLIVVVAPFCEELFFRGTVYRLFSETLSPKIAAVISGLIFSLIHQELMWILPVWLLGYVLAREYEKTARIGVPMIIHACQNALSFCLLIYLLS